MNKLIRVNSIASVYNLPNPNKDRKQNKDSKNNKKEKQSFSDVLERERSKLDLKV